MKLDKKEYPKTLHYKYTCKKTGKSALAPHWSTGFPGNFVDCKVAIEDKDGLGEPCRSCDLQATREEAGFH